VPPRRRALRSARRAQRRGHPGDECPATSRGHTSSLRPLTLVAVLQQAGKSALKALKKEPLETLTQSLKSRAYVQEHHAQRLNNHSARDASPPLPQSGVSRRLDERDALVRRLYSTRAGYAGDEIPRSEGGEGGCVTR
jgi:hypothetical protein